MGARSHSKQIDKMLSSMKTVRRGAFVRKKKAFKENLMKSLREGTI
jgi:hypothetical protein